MAKENKQFLRESKSLYDALRPPPLEAYMLCWELFCEHETLNSDTPPPEIVIVL